MPCSSLMVPRHDMLALWVEDGRQRGRNCEYVFIQDGRQPGKVEGGEVKALEAGILGSVWRGTEECVQQTSG